jgi:iron complex outermembrane receptor protein
VDSLSSELRLSSPHDGRIRYVAAAYFSQVESSRDFIRGSNDLSQYGTFTTVPPTTSAYSTYTTRARARNYALFATSTYRTTSRFEFVTGLRLNRELLDYSLTDRLNQTHFGQPRCSATTPSGLLASTCDDFNSVTGRAAITYRPVPAMMVFGSYDRGYKGAAYDLTSTYTTRSLVTAPGPTQGYPIGDAVASRQPVAPESVDSFQLGVKGTLRDRVGLSLTLFDASFHNYQAQSRDELTGQNMLNSVEEVRTRGVEMELTASPLRDVQLNVAGAYNSAVARTFTNAPCYSGQTAALGCVSGRQDLSGQTLANAPRWTFNLDASYGLQLGTGSRVLLDAGFHWKSDFMHSLLRDPMSRQGAYGILNAAVGLERRHWSLRVFVVNALDKNFSLSRSRDGNWNINPYGASPGPVTDAVKWAPARDSARYFGVEFRTGR